MKNTHTHTHYMVLELKISTQYNDSIYLTQLIPMIWFSESMSSYQRFVSDNNELPILWTTYFNWHTHKPWADKMIILSLELIRTRR
jgi:hypothetical protein